VVLESIASAQDTTCFSHPRDGHHATSGHESSCESFRIDNNTQGVRTMSFTRKDFACLQMKKCVGVNVMADLPSGTAAAASESGNDKILYPSPYKHLILIFLFKNAHLDHGGDPDRHEEFIEL
jgi:hypothetical protein